MATFLPFRAVRPTPGLAPRVVCPPYDVVDRCEARALAAGNDYSYLRVVRSDIAVDDSVPSDADEVYEAAARTFWSWLNEGVLALDPTPTYTVYREHQAGRTQTGIVGLASIDDYASGVIKRHEVTLVPKERDRVRHFETVGAHTEPIWLAHRPDPTIAEVVARYTATTPLVDVTDAQGVRHEVWPIADSADIDRVREAFANLGALYIADGHHRAASATTVGTNRRQAGLPVGEADRVMAVAFAADQLHIIDYNRYVTDLGDLDAATFLAAIADAGFTVEASESPVRPHEPRTFGLYVGGHWYVLHAPQTPERHGAKALDVALLHDLLLEPVLGISDPRNDPRIGFVGGIRGLDPLVEAADRSGGAAFTVPPVTMETIMAVADAGEIMPPKSTWFEPKLGSGLFAHLLDEPTSSNAN
ncbi:MAG: DUF1015 domain-containing protein [Actinomycetaceae bacterium]|nr:DUF1015 domain-containing protein [Actinomycetaceae bacterium]MDU0970018.1 DUF1015 domain-containing protein [Actinomycetaceae bacterium]